MRETWGFLCSPAAGAAWNMAMDEALLHTAAKRGRPLLRVYAWEKPSVSFGYFQKFPAPLAERHDVVRRPTGGGVVYHVQDTTYTVVVPPAHALYAMKTADAYCALHQGGRRRVSIPAGAAPCPAAVAARVVRMFPAPGPRRRGVRRPQTGRRGATPHKIRPVASGLHRREAVRKPDQTWLSGGAWGRIRDIRTNGRRENAGGTACPRKVRDRCVESLRAVASLS